VNRFIEKRLTYYPIIIRLAALRPDAGVYTLRVIPAHIFINPQSYSCVTLKNKVIKSFLCSVNDASFNVYEKRIQHAIWFQEKNILQLFPELLFSVKV